MTTAVIGTCKAPGCSAEMIPQKVWLRRPDLRTNRRHGGHGMCSTCYNRARRAGTLPNPAPPKPPREPKRTRTLTTPEAVVLLQAIDRSDPETAHSDADDVLLRYVARTSPAVHAAYMGVVNGTDWWASA